MIEIGAGGEKLEARKTFSGGQSDRDLERRAPGLWKCEAVSQEQ